MRGMLLLTCLVLALAGSCRAGTFADTMEDELIFLPDDEDGEEEAPLSDPAASDDGEFASDPYVIPEPKPYVAGGGPYDHLPRFFGEMNKYDRIAMEPYKDTYDSMSLKDKADAYSRQFEYMNNRKPRFSPRLVEEIENATDPLSSRKYMYKPPPRKKPREEPKPVDLGALPGPWSQNAPPPEPEPLPAEPQPDENGEYPEFYQSPDGTLVVPPDRRMETLRGDWNIRRMNRRQR